MRRFVYSNLHGFCQLLQLGLLLGDSHHAAVSLSLQPFGSSGQRILGYDYTSLLQTQRTFVVPRNVFLKRAKNSESLFQFFASVDISVSLTLQLPRKKQFGATHLPTDAIACHLTAASLTSGFKSRWIRFVPSEK